MNISQNNQNSLKKQGGQDRQNFRKRKFSNLNSELQEYLNTHPSEKYTLGTRLSLAWENVANKKELEHTDNISYAKNSNRRAIIIFTDNSHWAAELSIKKELYRLLLEKQLNEPVEDVKFLVNRKIALKKIFQKKQQNVQNAKKDTPLALTAAEDRHARELVKDISDQELQNKLYKALKADLEWKKGQTSSKLP